MNSEEPTKAVVQYKGEMVTITFRDIKELICPMATDQEVAVFLRICQSLNLNPFASEIYLIKYSEKDKAASVIAIDAYLKAGEANPNYDGHEAGIILQDTTGKLEFREGSFLLDGERNKLAGGWSKVYRKDRTRPFYMAVNKKECLRYRRDGSLTEFWTEEKQPSMLRKTALKRALVEAFPSLFAGTLANVEVMEEGELPPAYIKNGDPYWKKWWARQREKGLSEDEVHKILGITSLKADWIEKGKTFEEAEDIINAALEKAKQTTEAPQALEDRERQLCWKDICQLMEDTNQAKDTLVAWFKRRHNLVVSLEEVKADTPPRVATLEMLKQLQDNLRLYKDQMGKTKEKLL